MPRVPRLEDMPDVLTVPEAAQVLRIGRDRCYEMVRTGEIPSFKWGKQFRIAKVALARFLGGGSDVLVDEKQPD